MWKSWRTTPTALAQVAARDLVHIRAVQEDHAVVEVVEARQQADDGALAGAGGADDGQLLAGCDRERDAVQHGLAAGVGELGVAELHLALEPFGELHGVGRLMEAFVPVERLEDALARSHGPEQRVEEPADGLDGVDHHVDVLGEKDEHAEADLLLDHLAAAEPQDAHRGNAAEAHVERLEHHLVVDGVVLVATVGAVQFTVLLGVHRLAAGDLHHLDADQVFLHVLVERRDGVADAPEDLAHDLAEVVGSRGNGGEGNDRKAHAGEVDAHVEHDRERDEEREATTPARPTKPTSNSKRFSTSLVTRVMIRPDRDVVVERRGLSFPAWRTGRSSSRAAFSARRSSAAIVARAA